MADITLNPVTPSTNGAIVTASNPLPVSLVSGAPVITNYTWASVPTPTSVAGKIVFVTNYGTKGSLLVSDGTRWKPVSGSTVLATLDTVSSSIANSETIVFQYLIPAAALQSLDRLKLWLTFTKSGTTDTGNVKIRLGTGGTTSDTQIISMSALSAANRSLGMVLDFRLTDATHLQVLGAGGGAGFTPGYTNASANAFPSAVTITSAAANALYFSVSISSSSTNDTVALQDAQLQLISSAN